MGILPGVLWVMAAPHHWPYGHNQTEANVPAVSCIISLGMARIPDGCDIMAKIWQKFDLQIATVVRKCNMLTIKVSDVSALYSENCILFHINNNEAEQKLFSREPAASLNL